ncbi:MAG: hypothetical protein NZ893_00545 [Candidatus Aenigmarchaeota archaeon]|nr:hypothetical protein [Candidatus Aenigmarchaeota archaeon]
MKGYALIFVLGLIFLATCLVILSKLLKWECVKNPFECKIKENKLLIKIFCVLERCLDGCDSEKCKKLQYDGFKCEESCTLKSFLDYVKENEQYFEYSYCGLQYNLKLTLEDGEQIELKVDDIKKFFKSLDESEYFQCIVVHDATIDDVLREEKLDVGVIPGPGNPPGKIYVDKSIVESYTDGRTCGPLPQNFKEASSIVLKGPLEIYITSPGELFYIDSGVTGSASFVEVQPYLIFITKEKYYKAKEGEIIFRLNRYRPLDDNTGIIFVYTQQNCGIGEQLNVYWHCGEEFNKQTICTGVPVELNICDKYVLKSDSLPSIILDYHYTPLFFNLDIK